MNQIEAAQREQQLLSDLEKVRKDCNNSLEKDQLNAKLRNLEAMKKQAEDNLEAMKKQVEDNLKANLEATNKYAKRGENATFDETERPRISSIFDVEKLTKMKDEYEKKLADLEAEKARLKEQLENEKMNSNKKEEVGKFEKRDSIRKEEMVQKPANLKSKCKTMEDENAKLTNKIIFLKEALEKKSKECKVFFFKNHITLL